MATLTCKNPKCDAEPGHITFDRYCAAKVCQKCGWHQGLARCYCGWAASGGNGRQELLDEGETIEPEDY